MRYNAPRSARSAGGSGDDDVGGSDEAHRGAATTPRAPLAGGEHGEAHGEAYGGDLQALVGRRVRKAFGAAGVFDGEVASCRDTRTHGRLWTVHYAADDDREDMSWQELRAVLLPAEEARAQQGPPPLPSPMPLPRRSTSGAPAARNAAPTAPAPAAPVPAAAALPVPAPPLHEGQQHTFKGVTYQDGADHVNVYHKRKHYRLGPFATALEAARAYDAELRRLGVLVVNFPRPGSSEVKAVRGVDAYRTLRAATLSPGRRGVRPLPTGFFAAHFFEHGTDKRVWLGSGFATEDEAARAVDAESRRRGLLHLLNVPLNDAERAAVRAHLSSGTYVPRRKRTRTRQATLPTRGAAAAAEDELGGGAGAAEAEEDADVASATVTPSTAATAVAGATDPLLRVARKRLAGGGVPTQLALQQLPQVRMPHGGGGGASGASAAMAADGAAPRASANAAAAAASKSDTTDMESFLQSVWPPLRCLHAALDAAAQCQVQRADLVTAAVAAPAYRRSLIAHACEELRIDDDGDREAFARAVEALAPR